MYFSSLDWKYHRLWLSVSEHLLCLLRVIVHFLVSLSLHVLSRQSRNAGQISYTIAR